MNGRALGLRHQFDASFAEPIAAGGRDAIDLLALEIGGRRHLLRVADVAALHRDRAITQVPSRRGELLGVTADRGNIVAVWDLGALLGAPPARAARWMVVLRAGVALAFEHFAGYLRTEAGGGGVVVVAAGAPEPVIDIAAILAAIEPKE